MHALHGDTVTGSMNENDVVAGISAIKLTCLVSHVEVVTQQSDCYWEFTTFNVTCVGSCVLNMGHQVPVCRSQYLTCHVYHEQPIFGAGMSPEPPGEQQPVWQIAQPQLQMQNASSEHEATQARQKAQKTPQQTGASMSKAHM